MTAWANQAIAVYNLGAEVHWSMWTDGDGWSTPLALAPGSTPRVASNGEGVVFAVWVDSGNVWATRRVGASGWESPVALSTATTLTPGSPVVVVDRFGGAHVIWAQCRGTRCSAYTNRYDPDVGWQEARDLSTVDVSIAVGNVALALDEDGNGIATFSTRPGEDPVRWTVRYSAETGWGPATPPAGLPNAFGGRVAMDASGRAIAVWHQPGAVEWTIWASRFE